MPDEPCIHELDRRFCADCNGTAKRTAAAARPDLSGFGPWFTARRAGTCGGCEEAIEPGDMIRADGECGYACWECGES
jgi:hypothetical protein